MAANLSSLNFENPELVRPNFKSPLNRLARPFLFREANTGVAVNKRELLTAVEPDGPRFLDSVSFPDLHKL